VMKALFMLLDGSVCLVRSGSHFVFCSFRVILGTK
jgi:hypothetical protein